MAERLWTITLLPAPELKKKPGCDGSKSGDVVWRGQGYRQSFDRDGLRDLFCEPVAYPAKFLGPLYVGGTMPGDQRVENTQMEQLCLLTLDIEKDGASIEDTCHALREHAFFLYTTWNHLPDQPRFRVVLPLARDISPAEYRRLWRWAARVVAGVDPIPKDPTRASFLPAEGPYFRCIDESDTGPVLDPDAILSQVAEAPAQRRASLPVRSILEGIPAGQRDNALFAYACSLRARGVRQEEARLLVEKAAAVCRPPFPADEAQQKVERVWRIYAGKPGRGELDEAAEAMAGQLDALCAIEAAPERLRKLSEALADPGFVSLWELIRANAPRRAEALLLRLEATPELAAFANRLRQPTDKTPSPSLPAEAGLQAWADERPALARLQVPPGWTVEADGIYQEPTAPEGSPLRIAHAPLLVTGRLTDLHTGTVALHLEWRCDGRWRSQVVPREQAMNARDLVGLARWGAPVDSTNARSLVRFLAAMEAGNDLPQAQTTDRMGWQGEEGFLWGKTLVRPAGDPHRCALAANPEEWSRQPLHLDIDAADGGAQVVEGLQAGGSWQGWLDTWALCQPHPALMLALYTALVPPLLKVIPQAPNWILLSRGSREAARRPRSGWRPAPGAGPTSAATAASPPGPTPSPSSSERRPCSGICRSSSTTPRTAATPPGG